MRRINDVHFFCSDSPQLNLIVFLTNKEDDGAVTLSLVHGIHLCCPLREADPEVFNLSRIEGHQRPVSLCSPEVGTFPREERDMRYCTCRRSMTKGLTGSIDKTKTPANFFFFLLR